MKAVITRLDRQLQRRFPNAYYRLIQRPRIRLRFKAERQLSRGISLTQSKHRSILFFTTQKCASRYVDQLLGRLAKAEGLVPIDFDAYVAMDKPPRHLSPFAADGTRAVAFQPAGYYYGPFGSWREIPEMDAYAVVLQLRDPRDVLTSLYYSTAFSHALINRKVIRRRQAAQQMSVDEYVLANSDEVLRIYRRYCDKLVGAPGVLFLKYEHMVADFRDWLGQLSTHVGLSHQRDILDALLAEADFEVEYEDKYSQRRQVTPGDHRRKLAPETIRTLNQQFEPILEALHYEI